MNTYDIVFYVLCIKYKIFYLFYFFMRIQQDISLKQ